MSTNHFDESAAAEVTLVYHTVGHNQSYNSLDCTTKFLSVVFKESPAAKHIGCGKTKSRRTVSQVSVTGQIFAPEASQQVFYTEFYGRIWVADC